MSTVTEIIDQAYREGNITSIGTAPTSLEIAEALPRLNNYIKALFGTDLGEHLRDWFVPTNLLSEAPLRIPRIPDGSTPSSTTDWIYPSSNSRILSRISSASTIYFPAMPSDGARMSFVEIGATAAMTLHGNYRLIETAASVTGVSGRTWFYRADLGNWARLTTLVEGDSSPFPDEFDDLLVTGLCIRLAARFGVYKDLEQTVFSRNAEMLSKLKKRYTQTEGQPTSPELLQHMESATLFMPLF